MVVTEFPEGSVLNKTSGIYCEWQWQSLVPQSVLVKLHVFTVNGSDGVLWQSLF